MFNSLLLVKGYNPQFSGHETFPLRYGWLKKAYDAVKESESHQGGSVFSDASAIAKFGVGKNMVASIRHWATQCEVIESEVKGVAKVANFGKKIFDDNGLDPYMENPSTLWLLHWKLATNSRLTTWYWAFNHLPSDSFERDSLVQALVRLGEEQGWSKMSAATIKRDVECFVRTYAAKPVSGKYSHEDAMESPLTELSLIKPLGKKDGFRIIRGAKATLGDGVFAYAVNAFWNAQTNANTLSLEALSHQPGSPGRIFQLGEEDLIDRLVRIEEITGGKLEWSETAGLKQLVRSEPLSKEQILGFVDADYLTNFEGKVA